MSYRWSTWSNPVLETNESMIPIAIISHTYRVLNKQIRVPSFWGVFQRRVRGCFWWTYCCLFYWNNFHVFVSIGPRFQLCACGSISSRCSRLSSRSISISLSSSARTGWLGWTLGSISGVSTSTRLSSFLSLRLRPPALLIDLSRSSLYLWLYF